MNTLAYIRDNWPELRQQLLEHIQISATALLIALLIALPLGIALARRPRLATAVLSLLGMLYTVPSLSFLVLFIPLFGLSATTAIVTLVIYAQIILVRNVVAGIQSVSPALIEAARGMGMNGWQRWWRIEFPLALPVILAGVRIAAVVTIGIATIASKISAGGLGTSLFQGVTLIYPEMIFAGALVVGLLAITVNMLLLGAERLLDPAARIRRSERRAQPRPAHPA